MGKYSEVELSEALQFLSSTISKCEKQQTKFAEGTSHHTLLKNRIKAMYISKALITEDSQIDRYSNEELFDALKPVASLKCKCVTGRNKHEIETRQFKRFQKIIDVMDISTTLITNEINKRS